MRSFLKISCLTALTLSTSMLSLVGKAQQVPTLVSHEARLETVLVLNVNPDTYVEFGIKKINDSLYQIVSQPEDVFFNVESTGNWNLSFATADPYFRGINDTTLKIPVDFMGFYIESTGENWDDGLFSNIVNATKDTVLFLSSEKRMVLESGERNNIGGKTHNSFILRWKFFYEDDALKTRKFSDFNIKDDYYNVKFYITLSESTVSPRRKE